MPRRLLECATISSWRGSWHGTTTWSKGAAVAPSYHRLQYPQNYKASPQPAADHDVSLELCRDVSSELFRIAAFIRSLCLGITP